MKSSCLTTWAWGLVLLAAVPSRSLGQLWLDFNDRSNDLPLYTQEGFDTFVIGSTGSSTAAQTGTRALRYGTLTVSLWDTYGGTYDDRRRTTPANGGAFTQAQLLQDFVFAVGTTTSSSLSVRIQGLASNQLHQLTVWSYDSSSAGTRVSDWYANGVLVSQYTFNGAVPPLSDTDYRFSFSANSGSAGEILLEGRRNAASVDAGGAAAPGVFLNALEVTPIPDQRPPRGTLTHFRPGSNLYGWTGGATFAEQDQEVALLKAAGVYRARINVVWFAVEPNQKGAYDPGLLALYDHLMQRLGENGIRAVFVTADTPYWASADPAKYTDASGQHWNSRYKATSPHDLADYLVFLLNRYRSTGPHAFEIWNEQDTASFWPSGPDAADYLNYLRAAYVALKAADTNAIVLNGGVTDNSTGPNFLSSLYAAGGGPYFDVWSQHTYRRAPQYETVVQTVRDIMVANGDAAKKLWITEAGWPTYTNSPTDPSAVSFARQAHYLDSLFTRLATYPYVSEAQWYTSRSYDETLKEGSFGLALPDFTPKPSFYAFSNWVVQASRPSPPTALEMLGVSFATNGGTRVSFSAPTGFTYALQASSNLVSWFSLVTNVSPTNAVSGIEDPSAAASAVRFYRLLWPGP